MKNPIFLIVGGLVLLTWGTVTAREVPINPITPDVKEKIKEPVKLVGNVDENVAPKVKDLENIFKMYTPCKGRDDDKGCVQLKEQIGEKRGEVIKEIGASLPEMKQTITSTAQSLGGSIKAKTMRTDLKSLYENLSKKMLPQWREDR
jgi:hypothetical protein